MRPGRLDPRALRRASRQERRCSETATSAKPLRRAFSCTQLELLYIFKSCKIQILVPYRRMLCPRMLKPSL